MQTASTTTSKASASTAQQLPARSIDMDSLQLLKGQKSITIAHNGALYRLQATKLGKLILTK